MNSKKDIELLCFKFEKKLSHTPNAIIRVEMIIDYCRNNYSSIKNILHLVNKGIQLSEEEGYNKGVAALKIYKAFDLWYTNKHKEAVGIINQYNHQLLAASFYFEYALAQNIVSLIAWSRGELESAFETIFEGLDKVKGKQGNQSALARMNMTLAVLYYDLNELELSYSHYKLCQKKLRECKLVYDYGTDIYSLIGLASIYKQQKAYTKSRKLLEESLKLSYQYNMWMTVARAKYELGCLEMLIGNDISAIELISKSFEIRKAHNTSASMVSCLYKLGELNLKLMLLAPVWVP
jgi:tetratricopeptide (TPR) repeat protein